MQDFAHQAVLLEEAVTALITEPSGFYVDGTFGRGGHSGRILDHLESGGRLLGIDKDPEAQAQAQHLLQSDARFSSNRFGFIRGSFADLAQHVAAFNRGQPVAGVMLDLGVSSPQLDDPARGFSFMVDGPLDMRMNPDVGQSAAQWIASAEEQQMATVFKEYGEERYAKRIARCIVAARRTMAIESTLQLAELIKRAHPRWEKHKHPATRCFQALRIVVNEELNDLKCGLHAAFNLLGSGGRLVVISFHSLEDRIVKQFIQRQVHGEATPRGLPLRDDQIVTLARKVGKAIKPSQAEVDRNPRARSAVMRVVERR